MQWYGNNEKFRSAIFDAGLTNLPSIFPPGTFVRFPGAGKKKSNKAGWAKMFPDGRGGIFGDFSSGLFATWQAKRDRPYTEQEKAEFRRKCEAERKLEEQRRKTDQKKAAGRACSIWNTKTSPCESSFPYLVRKSIATHGARLFKNNIAIPVVNEKAKLVNLQLIDEYGSKKFLKDGQTKGCSFWVGQNTETLLIAEGFATACTLHQETGLQCFISFYADNLPNVATIVRQAFPFADIIICGDNDKSGKGQEAAMVAALACQGKYIVPPTEGMDFNDYINAGGAI